MHAMDLVTVADEVCSRKLEQYDPHDMLCTTGRPPRNDSACNVSTLTTYLYLKRPVGIYTVDYGVLLQAIAMQTGAMAYDCR